MRSIVRVARRVSLRADSRAASTATRAHGDETVSAEKPKTAVMMLNMGGPSSLEGKEDGVGAFLDRLFADGEIITLGKLQNWLVRDVTCPSRAAPPRAGERCTSRPASFQRQWWVARAANLAG